MTTELYARSSTLKTFPASLALFLFAIIATTAACRAAEEPLRYKDVVLENPSAVVPAVGDMMAVAAVVTVTEVAEEGVVKTTFVRADGASPRVYVLPGDHPPAVPGITGTLYWAGRPGPAYNTYWLVPFGD